METLLTVLITLMVVSLLGAVVNLVRLNRKADELDTLKLDLVDTETRMEKWVDELIQEREKLEETLTREIDMSARDCRDRIEKWVASTDRRFDKAYSDIRQAIIRLKKLDDTVNPNKDLLKSIKNK